MDAIPPVLMVFLFALVTAVATGVGALPFLLVPKISKRWLSLSNAIAAGLMGAASWSLIFEGTAISIWRTAAGALVGLIFIYYGSRVLDRHQGELHFGAIEGVDARKILLIIAVMTLHSFTEGVGVGVSFGGGQDLGVYITAAIAIHNIPEGLAISLVMIPRGSPVWKAALWSIFSSLPQPLMAVPSYWFVETFQPILPAGLGFAAGAMIWMIFAELIPDAMENASPRSVATTVTLAIIAMLLFQNLIR